ncbi:endonuclease III [Trueperella sp. LYQ143]|uniref:endonuclease III n=1 Tax=Trueperella sp. LYQ143 TaxID=3391059 RepID=UPI0039836AE6
MTNTSSRRSASLAKNTPQRANSRRSAAATRRKKRQPRNVEPICDQLAKLYPDARCSLTHRNAFELLVATVLSAQTTDERVNSVTGELFERYPDAQTLAGATIGDLQRILRPLGFFRAKADSLSRLSRSLVHDFGGDVPQTLEELVTLAGVGRKTANVVLGNAFNTPGITVDTHVGRLSRRWGWTKETNAEKAERDLMDILPKDQWTVLCHRIIAHGRAICHARGPQCGICPIASLCPSAKLESA